MDKICKYVLGQRVRTLREARGHTKTFLAKRVGINSSFLASIEKGEKGVSAATLASIAISLRVSTDYLLFGEDRDCYTIGQLILTLNPEEQKNVKKLFENAVAILDSIQE